MNRADRRWILRHSPNAKLRDCGECKACCTALRIDAHDIKKPNYEPCQHLTPGGCGIYGIRPATCRRYVCLWLIGSVGGDSARPDRAGIIFGLDAPAGVPQVTATPTEPGGSRYVGNEEVRQYFASAIEKGWPVTFQLNKAKQVTMGKMATLEAMHAASPDDYPPPAPVSQPRL